MLTWRLIFFNCSILQTKPGESKKIKKTKGIKFSFNYLKEIILRNSSVT